MGSAEPGYLPLTSGGGASIADQLIDVVASAEGVALIVLVLALVFAESAVLLDFIVPGEVGLLVAGAAAERNGTPLVWVVIAATIGAVAGDCAGFGIGRRFGTGALHRWRVTRHLADDLDAAREQLDRHGGPAVALARWIGALRAVLPVVAGASKLRVGRMLAWSAPSALAWSAVVSTLGYAYGEEIAGFVDRIGLLVSALGVAVVIVLWKLHRRRSSRGPSDASSVAG